MKQSKYQNYKIVEVARSTIKLAEYNPRVINKEAEKKLKKKIKNQGLVSPLIYNKRTMTLLAGHQRIKQLDKLEKYPKNDYLLTMSEVDISLKEEKEMNVFLNNVSAQGDWDYDLLETLVDETNFDDMGFEESDMDMFFSDNSTFVGEHTDTEEVKQDKEKLNKIKAERKKMNDKYKDANSADYYFYVVCENQKKKDALLKLIGLPINEMYVDGYRISQKIEKGANNG